MQELERELKQLLIEVLNLEDISVEQIDSEAPCYPAFPQLTMLHEWHRDGVNHAPPFSWR